MTYLSPAVVAIYGLSIASLYDQFHQQTGNEIAAALLVLAQVQTEPPEERPTLFTVKQAAAKLGISVRTVYELVTRGTLKCRRLGVGRGVIRFSEDDLNGYREPSVNSELDPAFAALLRKGPRG